MSSQKVLDISTLKELRQTKERLSKESNIAEKAISKSLQTTQRATGNFLLKTVVAPIGTAGLVYLLASKLRRSAAKDDSHELARTSSGLKAPPNRVEASGTNALRTNNAPSPQGGPNPPSTNQKSTWKSLLTAGKFLVPLVRLIIGVVNKEVGNQVPEE